MDLITVFCFRFPFRVFLSSSRLPLVRPTFDLIKQLCQLADCSTPIAPLQDRGSHAGMQTDSENVLSVNQKKEIDALGQS